MYRESETVYEGVKSTTADFVPNIDGKVIPFDKRGTFRVKDKGLADEIQAKYGTENVIVDPTRIPDMADRGHKYFFTVPEMPWKRSQHNGNKEESQESAGQENRSTDAGGHDGPKNEGPYEQVYPQEEDGETKTKEVR